MSPPLKMFSSDLQRFYSVSHHVQQHLVVFLKLLQASCGLWISYLVQTLGPQVDQCSEDTGRKWLSCLLDAEEQRNLKNPPAFHLRHLGLPRRFRNSPVGDRDVHYIQQQGLVLRRKFWKLLYAQKLFCKYRGNF